MRADKNKISAIIARNFRNRCGYSKKTMKILLINKFLYPKGGDAIVALNTGKLLSEKGHRVFFWGMKHPMNPQYPYSEYFVDNIDYEGNLSRKQKISNR